MSKKETRPLREQGAGQDKDNLSNIQFTTSGNGAQEIFCLLPMGEANAISSKTLAKMAGYKSVRDLQHGVAAERDSGALILSTCRNGGGYYRPSDGPEGQAEISHFVATLRSRALNTLKALRAAKAALAKAEGQITLDELEGL